MQSRDNRLDAFEKSNVNYKKEGMIMKKFVSVFLVSALMLSLVSCGPAADSGTSQTDSAGESAGESASGEDGGNTEIRKISILNGMFSNFPPDVDPSDNEYINALKEALPDIEIEWILVPPAQLTEKKNQLMGSGDFPDVVPGSMSEIIKWADQGLIMPIDDYFDLYPNIYNFLTDDAMKDTIYNGKRYGIKSPNNPVQNPNLIYLRKDWLENLGLETPTTPDELYEVFRAFTQDDPDGNGQDDTFGLAFNKNQLSMLEPLFSAFGVAQNQWSTVDGQIIPDIIRPEMKEALAYLQKLYTEGLIDKDSTVMEGSNVEEKFSTGKIGAIYMAAYGFNSRVYKATLDLNPDADFDVVPVLTQADGSKMYPVNRGGGRINVINADCQYPEAVMEFQNWLIAENEEVKPIYQLNSDTIYFGEMYNLDDKYFIEKPVSDMTEEETVEREIRLSYRFHMGTIQSLPDEKLLEVYGLQEENGTIYPLFTKSLEDVMDSAHLSDCVVTGPVYTDKWNDIQTYWSEISVGIITGVMSVDEFDNWVNVFYELGGQEIIDEVNEMNQ